MKVAHQLGTSWELITVDSSSDGAIAPSIAIDNTDTVHLTWYDNAKGVLKYGQGR